jgi:hypothetical protein
MGLSLHEHVLRLKRIKRTLIYLAQKKQKTHKTQHIKVWIFTLEGHITLPSALLMKRIMHFRVQICFLNFKIYDKISFFDAKDKGSSCQFFY